MCMFLSCRRSVRIRPGAWLNYARRHRTSHTQRTGRSTHFSSIHTESGDAAPLHWIVSLCFKIWLPWNTSVSVIHGCVCCLLLYVSLRLPGWAADELRILFLQTAADQCSDDIFSKIVCVRGYLRQPTSLLFTNDWVGVYFFLKTRKIIQLELVFKFSLVTVSVIFHILLIQTFSLWLFMAPIKQKLVYLCHFIWHYHFMNE